MGCYPGVASRIGKNRNGGESFQELGKEREWGVTQGGQSERNSGDGFTLVHYFHPAGPLDSLTDPYVDRVYYTTQILRKTCSENMKLHIPHTLEIERN